ncbi:hypothetical protein ACJ5H2_13540 [Nocardioides sp. R1-1]
MNALWMAVALLVLALLLQVGGVVAFAWPVWAVLAVAVATGAAVAWAARR